MSLLTRFYLYNERKEKVISVIPYESDGTYNVRGLFKSMYSTIDKTMSQDELNKLISTHGLMREEELGQMNLFEIL